MAQTRPLDEIIVVDDASTDNSIEVVHSLAHSLPSLRLIRHDSNRGVVEALNTGIRACSGDFLFLCSANDTYEPHMVDWCEEMLRQYPHAGMVSGNAMAFDLARGRNAYALKLDLPQTRAFYTPQEFVRHNRHAVIHFRGGANALSRKLVMQLDGLTAELKWHSDWFVYQMIAMRHGFAYVPEQFSIIRLEGGKSYSSGLSDRHQQKEVLRQILIMLKSRFPETALLFREAATLPTYNLYALSMLFSAPFRWYITPILLWRILVYGLAYRLKHILPRPVLQRLRPLLRL